MEPQGIIILYHARTTDFYQPNLNIGKYWATTTYCGKTLYASQANIEVAVPHNSLLFVINCKRCLELLPLYEINKAGLDA